VDDKLTPFRAWMDKLNAEAIRRGYDPRCWPLPNTRAHRENCWIADFRAGLTPAQALDVLLGSEKRRTQFEPTGQRVVLITPE
jgi:hypothetical protein